MVLSRAPARISPRRLTALRLDLEDRQASLIVELYSLSVRHCADADARAGSGHSSIPDWRLELAASAAAWPDAGREGPPLSAVHQRLQRLYEINRALGRITSEDFGCCLRCGEPIDFDLLAGDPARLLCTPCEH